MKKTVSLALALCLFPSMAFAYPTTVVSGVVEYKPTEAYNGFTVLAGSTVKLIDMNGNLVHEWQGGGSPNKIYPGGFLGSALDKGLGIRDFDGNATRVWNQLYQAEDGSWFTNMHHDFQVEGNSAGYYSPSAEFNPDGKLLLLTSEDYMNPAITDMIEIHDDRIVVVDADGNVEFSWYAAEHVEQFYNIYTDPVVRTKLLDVRKSAGTGAATSFDWFHINCASWLGPNKWYDEDPVKYSMFHPENIISDSRPFGHMFIIDHVTGDVVWQVAPPFTGEDAKLGAFIGVHGTHMIPKGLPGEGNILVFDNGGYPGYHDHQMEPRPWSRVVEFDPVAKEIVWVYNDFVADPTSDGRVGVNFSGWQQGGKNLYSVLISNAQRLPNGNTLICEGTQRRLLEVTPANQIVWEYVNPYAASTYRAYRVPYEWVPQLPEGNEVSVTRPDSRLIILPNDDGVLPNIYPAQDSNLAPVFQRVSPVLVPALDGQLSGINVNQGSGEVDDDGDYPEDVTMKSY